jgi:hypothetical protein
MTASPTVSYFAISLFSSRTFWLNLITFIVAALSASDVQAIVPARFLPLAAALVAMANIYLRTLTVRPAAWITPGTTIAVAVPKIGPPDPPLVTD